MISLQAEQNYLIRLPISALLLEFYHSVQYPLEGYKKQENGEYF